MVGAREGRKSKDEMTHEEATRLVGGLGFLAWWSLREVDVPRAEMRAVFEKLGLGAAVQRDPRPSAVLARACREALVGRSGEWAFDRVRDDRDATVAALSWRTVDAGAESVGYAQVGTVRVDKATGAVSVQGDASAADVLDAARARFRHITDNATTEDLRAALAHSMAGRTRDRLLGAVDVNGVFFVREQERYRAQALAAWVRDRKFGEVSLLTVGDDETSRAQVSAGARQSIEGRVQEILADCSGLAERIRAAEEHEVDRILGPSLDRFALAEQAADLYADVLADMAADLKRAITEARSEFAKRVL